ncbi:hypothetical protein ACL6C3_20580 [Capilliphycus salinus ALCB114379]|uniref:hypothetical protein n=1 Tax=Capilliphycus salinus TaxID=2768948 RepID=UPI0039A5BBCC
MSKGAIIRLTLLFLMLVGLGWWMRQLTSGSSVEQLNQQARILEAIYTQGNYIEAGIWGVFAAGFAVAAFKNRGWVRVHRMMAAITFFLFGLSDIVEVETGGWWRPWWLFVWKSLCIISMIVLLAIYLKNRSTQR